MKRNTKNNQMRGTVALFLAIVVVLSLLPANILAMEGSSLTTNIDTVSFVTGTAAEFEFSTEANADYGTMVLGSFEFSDPDAIEKLEYKESKDGNWYEFYGDFGPAGGFPMQDATSYFRATFKKAGVYTVNAYMKAAEGGAVLCSTQATVNVKGSSELTTNIDKQTFVVGTATEFEFATVANGDKGTLVLGSFEFSDPDAIEKLEYKESKDGKWYEFYGDFGPAGGFPMQDATSYFRVTFNRAGTFTLHAYMKTAREGDILCSAYIDVVAKADAALSFDKDHLEIKYTDENATNKLNDSVADPEYTYSSDKEEVVTVNEYGVLTPKAIGKAIITVTRKETDSYISASASYTVEVVAGIQGELAWKNTVPESIVWNVPEGYTNTVRGGSGDGAVTYTSDNTDVAEVDEDGVVTLKMPGTVTITAVKDGGELYEDLSIEYTLVVVKAEPEALVFGDINPDAVCVGDTYTNTVSGGYEGGTVLYSSSDNTVASVDENGVLTALRVPAGEESVTVTITASLAGNDYYEKATANYEITIYRAEHNPPVYFEKGDAPQTITYGQEYKNEAFANTDITYSSSDDDIAEVDKNGALIIHKAGTVIITAAAAESEQYKAAEASYTITINKAEQTVVFENGTVNIEALSYGDEYKNTASANTDITYSSSDDEIAEVDENGKLIIKKAGTVTITATAAETEQYEAAEASYEITINKADQTVAFENGTNDTEITYGQEYKNEAFAETEITYSSSDNTVAEVDGNGNLIIHKAGTVIITATAAESEQYNSAEAFYTLTINKADQSLEFEKGTEVDDITYGDDFTNAASPIYEATVGKITYSSSDNTVAEVDENGKLTIYKAGTVIITASYEENEQYKATEASYTLTINKADFNIFFEKDETVEIAFNYNDNKFSNPARSAPINNNFAIVYSVVDGEEFIVENTFDSATGEFEIAGAGEIEISVTFTDDERFNQNTASYTLTVNKADQYIAFYDGMTELGEDAEVKMINGDNAFVLPVARPKDETKFGTGAIEYFIHEDENGVVTKDEGTGEFVFTLEVGTVVFGAIMAGDDNYNASAPVYFTLVVENGVIENDYYVIEGPKTNSSNEWFIDDVTIKAKEDYIIGVGKGKNVNSVEEWKNEIVVSGDDEHELRLFVKNVRTGRIYGGKNEITIKIDTFNPAGQILNDKISNWDSNITIITREISDKNGIDFTVNPSDNLSGVYNVQYFIEEGSDQIKDRTALDAVSEWQPYTGVISVDGNKMFVVYAKITDNAGLYSYAHTNVIVYDVTDPNADIKAPEATNGYYNSDVVLDITATDEQISAGIASITYKIEAGDVVETGDLYTFDVENPEYSALETSLEKQLTIDSEKFNSDGVKVTVTVTDNAGNTTIKEITLNICVTLFTMEATYVDDPAPYDPFGDVKCYNAKRIAKIVITGRTTVFEKAEASIVVSETKGNPADETTYVIKPCETAEVEGNPDGATHTYYIEFNGSARYTFTFNYTDIFGNNFNHVSDKFAVDTDAPTASVTIDGTHTWDTLLSTITFGLWSRNEVEVTATANDATSGIKSFMVYRTDSTTLLSREKLDSCYADDDFVTYVEGHTIKANEKAVFYFRYEDYAGHYDYICSDGYIVEAEPSGITITLDETNRYHNDIPLYNGDVHAIIRVNENPNGAYSGIKEVTYKVECDGVVTMREPIKMLDYTMEDYEANSDKVPTFGDLYYSFEKEIVILASENNSCNVVLTVEVIDNAGNVYSASQALDIDKEPPAIKIEYNNNVPNMVVNGRGYYGADREARIIVTERSGHFIEADAIAGIKVKAVDAKGNPIVVNGEALAVDAQGYVADISKLFGNIIWTESIGQTPDSTTHTAVLSYDKDANYTFSISYTDLAGNVCNIFDAEGQQTPYTFTVDKTEPTAAITADAETWDKLLEFLTFGLYSGETVSISATDDDATSPVHSIEYYKTSDTLIKTRSALDAVTDWTDITADPEFTVSADERFVIYLKITDKAGNYKYICSDGYVVDDTPSDITLTPEATEHSHNGKPLYNGDVDVLIDVREQTETAYSGIKEIKYWVECDGKVSQPEEVIFSFNYEMADYVSEGENTPVFTDLVHEFSKTVTIKAQDNNSCDVVLYVVVTDNAGNVKTASVAVDIDITAPTISVSYSNNEANKVVGDKGYFSATRKATVSITERRAHFDKLVASDGILITAVDANGHAVISDCKSLIGAWTTVGVGENTVHSAVINFSADANYTFALSYTDLAGNTNQGVDTGDSVTPYKFAVDKTKPVGTVTAGEFEPWETLIQFLTFGLWSKDSVDVSVIANDLTTDIDSVCYYKTSDKTAKTATQLDEVSTWKPFNGLTVLADEQFVVYVRIIDYAGNIAYISTNGIIVDDTVPIVESVKPEITIVPEPTYGIYNSDVTVAVFVIDPKIGETEAYAGLAEITYEVKNMGTTTQSGVLYSFDTENPTYDDLVQEWSKLDAIVVDKDLNNSNAVEIIVSAKDNAGNSNSAECEIKIDITAPIIEVNFDNNNGDTSFADGVYFRANRTATIVVTERNFDPELVELAITNPHGYVPAITGWTTVEGSGNGDNTTNVAYVTFDRDGDYTFDVSCTDAAENASADVDFGASLAPERFTVDKTAPVVNVSYDNNDSLNGNYYKAQRTATITVTEHNFETGRISISLKATDNGADVQLPTVSQWTTDGDVHTATITYAADALYVFDFDYRDKAGNAIADIAEQSFYVDLTNPVVTIEKIVDRSANNSEGNIGFVMSATDTNLDVFTPVVTAVIKNGNTWETKQIDGGEIADITNGKMFTVSNLETDGIYRITCTVVDKAGNAYSEVVLENADGEKYSEQRSGEDALVTFSVNREGSTFELDESVVELLDKYYVQNVNDDVVLVEINVDPLKEYVVTLNDKVLVKDTDYSVTEEGGNGAWMKYTYKISKTLFVEEGEYKLVVSSTDKADNDAFSDIKDATVEFVVDRTAPVVAISGLENGGRYQTESQLVTLIPTDDGGELKSLVVNMVDEDGKVIKEAINLADKALATELEANDGKITFEIAEGLYQNVQIICTDTATGENEETNTYNETIENVSVSSSGFMIFWANKPLRWGIIGGISLAIIAIVLLIVKKNKKRKTTK